MERRCVGLSVPLYPSLFIPPVSLVYLLVTRKAEIGRSHRLKISRLPVYSRLLALGRERADAILLDVGCCCTYTTHLLVHPTRLS